MPEQRLVRRSTAAGVYELDRSAPDRLGHRLAKLQLALRQGAVAPSSTADLALVRARRDELTAQIAQVERALEECENGRAGSELLEELLLVAESFDPAEFSREAITASSS